LFTGLPGKLDDEKRHMVTDRVYDARFYGTALHHVKYAINVDNTTLWKQNNNANIGNIP
jgi:hypothetical protein